MRVPIKGIKTDPIPKTIIKEKTTTKQKPVAPKPIFSILRQEIDLAGENFKKTYLRLKADLRCDVKRATPDELQEHLDESHRNALEATYLLAVVREQCDKADRELQIRSTEWEVLTDGVLTELKNQKKISGQITESMRKKYMLKNYPEYKELEIRWKELERHKKVMKSFALMWEKRSDIIRSLAKYKNEQQQVKG